MSMGNMTVSTAVTTSVWHGRQLSPLISREALRVGATEPDTMDRNK